MRNPIRYLLAAAVVSFGAVASVSAPARADSEIIPCDGRQEPLCGTSTSEECTKRVICGVTSNGLILCCAEKQITKDYHYFN
jgi:hypothetical protein